MGAAHAEESPLLRDQAKRTKSEDANAAPAPTSDDVVAPPDNAKANGTSSAGAMLAAAMADLGSPSSDEDIPMAESSQPVATDTTAADDTKTANGAKRKPSANGKAARRRSVRSGSDGSPELSAEPSSEDEVPMATQPTTSSIKPRKPAIKKPKYEDDEEKVEVNPKNARKMNGPGEKLHSNGKDARSKGKAKAEKKETYDERVTSSCPPGS